MSRRFKKIQDSGNLQRVAHRPYEVAEFHLINFLRHWSYKQVLKQENRMQEPCFLYSSNVWFFLCYLSFHLDQRNVIVKGLLHKVGVEEHLKRKDNNTIIAELYCWGHHVLDLCHHKSEKKLYWNCTCRCHHNLQKIPFQSIFVADVPRDDVGRGRQEPIWFGLDWS